MHAGARAKIDNMVGTPHRFLVVLHDHERISFFAQRRKRIEQTQVIARMQTNRWFIKHVKHATQIGAQLGGEPDPLRFAAAQRFGRTAKREITKPDVFHELQPLLDFGKQFRRDCFVRAAKPKFSDDLARLARGKGGEIVYRKTLHPHVTRNRVQTRAVTARTFVRLSLVYPFRFTFGGKFVLKSRIAIIFRARLQIAVPNFAEPAAFLAGAMR